MRKGVLNEGVVNFGELIGNSEPVTQEEARVLFPGAVWTRESPGDFTLHYGITSTTTEACPAGTLICARRYVISPAYFYSGYQWVRNKGYAGKWVEIANYIL